MAFSYIKICEGEMEMDFGKVLEALKEGKKVKRFSDEKVYMLKQDGLGSDKKEDQQTLIASVNEDGKTLAYYSLTTDGLLADDWQVFEL
jgi:Protein of unknown function (DUF2829)